MQASMGLPQEPVASVAKVETPVSMPPVDKALPAPKKPATSAALPLHYEFIGSDLKRIGVLACIILALLIVAYYLFT